MSELSMGLSTFGTVAISIGVGIIASSWGWGFATAGICLFAMALANKLSEDFGGV